MKYVYNVLVGSIALILSLAVILFIIKNPMIIVYLFATVVILAGTVHLLEILNFLGQGIIDLFKDEK